MAYRVLHVSGLCLPLWFYLLLTPSNSLPSHLWHSSGPLESKLFLALGPGCASAQDTLLQMLSTPGSTSFRSLLSGHLHQQALKGSHAHVTPTHTNPSLCFLMPFSRCISPQCPCCYLKLLFDTCLSAPLECKFKLCLVHCHFLST